MIFYHSSNIIKESNFEWFLEHVIFENVLEKMQIQGLFLTHYNKIWNTWYLNRFLTATYKKSEIAVFISFFVSNYDDA